MMACVPAQVHSLKAKSEKEYIQRMKDQVGGAGYGMLRTPGVRVVAV
jgi:hypothetical protein